MKRSVTVAAVTLLILGALVLANLPRRGVPAHTAGTYGAIVFERLHSDGGDTDLFQVSPGGGHAQLLRADAGDPHWSPGGRALAFETCLDPPTCDTAVALLDPATGAVHGFHMPDPGLFTACAIWTPDATRLACEGKGQSDPTRNGIYSIRSSDGGGLTRVTSNPGGDDIPLDYSPDGGQVVFARTDPSRPSRANQALFIASTSGRGVRRLTPWGYTDDQASWSPDGHTILFGTGGSLYRVHPDGTGLAQIALHTGPGTQPGRAFDVAWSPDGTRLVFSLRPGDGPQASLYTATPDGHDVRALTTSPTGDHHADWGVRQTQ